MDESINVIPMKHNIFVVFRGYVIHGFPDKSNQLFHTQAASCCRTNDGRCRRPVLY